MSQLDLALHAGVSARHLSFLESSRAQPSREMLLDLADALAIPLRERNALLLAAGYAPIFRETGLTDPEMALALRAVEFIIKKQEPLPAIVMDRHWNLLQANEGAAVLLKFLLGSIPQERNVVRQVFNKEILRPFIANWDEVAADMIRRIQQEVDWYPGDEATKGLLAEVLSYPGIPAHCHSREVQSKTRPMLTFIFRKEQSELRFFSTWTTFGGPQDVTLEELRIESSFPADEATAEEWGKIVARVPTSAI